MPGSDTNEKNEYDTGFYSTSYYTDNLIRYFEERTEEDREKPFFAMLPFSAPHWPLQCSKADREKYKVSRCPQSSGPFLWSSGQWAPHNSGRVDETPGQVR